MVADAGPTRFALLSAHAPTANAAEDKLQAFWSRLAAIIRKFPRAATPVFCVDANARFAQELSRPRTSDSHPRCPNAEFLLDLCGEFGLEPSAQFSHGTTIVFLAFTQRATWPH